MKQEENLILRQNDVGNDIVFLFDTKLDDITSAEFRLIKPDNTFVILTGTVEENTAKFTITEQCCAIPGRCHFNLRLINSSSNIYTYVSNCIIDINLNLEDAIESTAELNGYIFPDDFALKNEIPDTDDFATKEYVNDAISQVPVYEPISYSETEQKTGRNWIDNKDIYEKTIVFENVVSVSYNTWTNLNVVSTGIDHLIKSNASDVGVCWGCVNISKTINSGYLSALTTRNGDSINIKYLTIEYTKGD